MRSKQGTPYNNEPSAWRYINFLYLMSKEQGRPLLMKAQTCSPITLRQRLFGGRYYIEREHNPLFVLLKQAARETIIRFSEGNHLGVELGPSTNFQFYWKSAIADDPYLSTLALADIFLTQPLRTQQIPRTFNLAQLEALKDYFAIRPSLRHSLLSDSLVVLRKDSGGGDA